MTALFKRLTEREEAQFRYAADGVFDEAVPRGVIAIDLNSWHPVYLHQLAKRLDKWADEREQFVSPPPMFEAVRLVLVDPDSDVPF